MTRNFANCLELSSHVGPPFHLLYKKNRTIISKHKIWDYWTILSNFDTGASFWNIQHKIKFLPMYSPQIIKVYGEIKCPYLIPLSSLNGSPEIPLTSTKRLTIVMYFIIRCINLFEKPISTKHFLINSHLVYQTLLSYLI